MNALFVIAALLLGVGILSLLGLFYLRFSREAEPGSLDLLIWSSVSAGSLILGDITMAFTNGLYHGHVWSTIGLVYLTLMPCVMFIITRSVRREKLAASA